MSSVVVPIQFIVIGICLLAALNHLLIGVRRGGNLAHVLFGVLCLLGLGYGSSDVSILLARDVEAYGFAQKCQLAIGAVWCILFPWFVRQYTGIWGRYLAPLIIAGYAAVFVFDIASDHSLYLYDVTEITFIETSTGELLADAEFKLGPAYVLTHLLHIALFSYTLYACYRQYKNDQRQKAVFLAAGITAFGIGMMIDFALRTNGVPFLLGTTFGFMGMIVSMSLYLSYEYRETALRVSEDRYRQLVEGIQDEYLIYSQDVHGTYTYLSPSVEAIFGVPPEHGVGKNWREVFDLDAETVQRIEQLEAGYSCGVTPDPYELKMHDIEGEFRQIEIQERVVVDRQGEPVAVEGIAKDVTASRLAKNWIAGQNRVLESLATGAELPEVLTLLVEAIESARPRLIGSVLLLDAATQTLRHGAGPGLPDFYNEAIHGMSIGPGEGSCGTAAHSGERVIVEDVMTHPFWVQFRDLADKAGLRACWSQPILDEDGTVLGTFAVYYRQPRQPSEADLELIASAAHLAGVAIAHRRSQESLVQAKEEWERTFDAVPDLITILDRDHRIVRANRAAANRLSRLPEQCEGLRCYEHFHGESNSPEFCPHAKLLADGKEHHAEIHEERLGGDFFVSASPLQDAEGNNIGAVHVARDITQRKQAERALQEAHRELEQLNAELEHRVQQRTAELEDAVARLEQEVSERKVAQEALAASEHNFRTLVETLPDAVTETDLDGRITYASPQTALLHGYGSPKQLLGRDAHELIVRDEREKARKNLETLEDDKWKQTEYCFLKTDGTCYPGELNVAVVRDEAGQPKSLIAVSRDISARKEAERALRESENLHRTLLEAMPFPVALFHDDKFAFANEATVRRLGFKTIDDLLGRSFSEIVAPEFRDAVGERLSDATEDTWLPAMDQRFVRPDGSSGWLSVTGTVIDYQGERRLLMVAQDITEQTEAEEAARKSEQSYQEIFNATSEAIFIHDAKTGELLDANEPMLKMYGVTREQVAELPFENYCWNRPPYTLETAAQLLQNAVEKGPQMFEWGARRFNGEEFWVEVALKSATIGGEDRVLAVVRDITERKQARDQLDALTTLHQSIVETAPLGIHVVDTELTVRAWNATFEFWSGVGREQMIGKHLLEVVPGLVTQGWDEKYRNVLATGVPFELDDFPYEVELGTAVGQTVHQSVRMVPLFENGKVSGVLTVLSDVTDKHRARERMRGLEAELTHVGRLSTMGEMASGMAHELNQPLASVSLFAQTCQELMASESDLSPRFREPLEAISREANRAAEIVRRLRGFARKRDHYRSSIDINALVSEVVELASHEAQQHHVVVEFTLADDLPLVQADPIQIQQVILNLIRNAIQAIVESNCQVRRVEILTETTGDTATVSVVDSGPGLVGELTERIFDPFFTTKEEGMGMGLSISRTIVEEHGGSLWVDSTEDRGASFQFMIPCVHGATSS